MKVSTMHFYEQLKGMRRTKGFTIRELADRSGVSAAYISQLENGNRGVPSPDVLMKLSEGLNTPYTELMKIAGYLEKPAGELNASSKPRINLRRFLQENDFIFDHIELTEQDKEWIERVLTAMFWRDKQQLLPLDGNSGDPEDWNQEGDKKVLLEADSNDGHATVGGNSQGSSARRISRTPGYTADGSMPDQEDAGQPAASSRRKSSRPADKRSKRSVSEQARSNPSESSGSTSRRKGSNTAQASRNDDTIDISPAEDSEA
ncbi:helix-turn-helix transcriptional regulator [Paenibacillus filicis]|uniref:Helix-turn-helix transcriptional regulator n=1 Tax=Paenibacillus filicis TaxID=669464 RepID=A0ABU9DBT7_9BACL